MLTYKNKIKKQRGFLLIVAIMLIIVTGFISMMLVYMFAEKTNAAIDSLQSYQAHYISMSGLEIAKHDIITNQKTCGSYSTPYQGSVFNEKYTVIGKDYSLTGELSGDINQEETSISIANISLENISSGIISIDNELIYFKNKKDWIGAVGADIYNVNRGVLKTFAATHLNKTPVELMMGTMSVTASLYDGAINDTVSQIFLNQNYVGFKYKNVFPTVVSSPGLGDYFNIWGGAVVNETVESCNIEGSNLVSSQKTYAIAEGGSTAVNTKHTICSTNVKPLKPDIVYGYNFKDNLRKYYFTDNCSIYEASDVSVCDVTENPTHNPSEYVLSSDESFNKQFDKPYIVYVPSNLICVGGSDVTIGSKDNPVLVYVKGFLYVYKGSKLTVYGILYVNGYIIRISDDNDSYNAPAQLVINGQLASSRKINMYKSGSITNKLQTLQVMKPFMCKNGMPFSKINTTLTPVPFTLSEAFASED